MEVCKSHGIAYIDSFSIFKPMLDKGLEYHVEDGVHFNDFAYEVIVSEIAKVLNS